MALISFTKAAREAGVISFWLVYSSNITVLEVLALSDGEININKTCKRVEFLVREPAELREMLKRTVTGHGLEEKGGETGDREVGLEEQEKGEEFLAPDKGEIRTEEGKEICAGATLMATHAYTRNPESPLGKEIYLQQWETLISKGEHAETEHGMLVEDIHGQVGYAPAAFLVVILDTTGEEGKSGATKKGQEDSTEENRIGGWIGQEGERRKSYSWEAL